MNRITKLHELDFSPGIRASYINENFDLLRRWIEEERLRVSGWGIVEGFDLSRDLDAYTITIGDGIIIDKTGAHLKVKGETITAGRPKAWNKLETLRVDEDSIVTLQYPIYSEDSSNPDYANKIVYYSSGMLPKDLTIIDEESQERLTSNDIDIISANEIRLMPGFVDHELTVSYKYANDRIDGIFINRDNVVYENGSSFRYELGESTDTPTCNKDEYIIGYVYWHVDKAIDAEFIIDDRTLRQVYVDKDGNLYLMGKLYDGYKFIFFGTKEEVSPAPMANDLWYDTDENILKIWRRDKEDDIFKWFPVNDLARFNREIKFYQPKDNPEDLQTFIFDNTADKNLVFVPNKNQLTIIIDQVVLMQDQFEELYDKNAGEFEASGYGFKLIEPLDGPKVIEVRVEHSANTQNYTQDLFSKVAAFIDEGVIATEGTGLPDKFFRLGSEYETQKCEVELWLDGVKLTKNLDFFEAVNEDGEYRVVASGEPSSLSNTIYIPIDGIETRTVVYKIIRFMATYSNFNASLEPIKNALKSNEDYAKEHIESIETQLEIFEKGVNGEMERIFSSISQIKEGYRKKDTPISASDIEDELLGKIIHKHNYFKRSAYNPDNISASLSDFISIIWVKDNERVPLVRNLDYEIEEVEENEAAIVLNTIWESNRASLYIETISLARG